MNEIIRELSVVGSDMKTAGELGRFKVDIVKSYNTSELVQQVLASDHHLKELVREADVEWGRRMDERPHFNRKDSAPHPDDPYTIVSVRTALGEVLERINGTEFGNRASLDK